MSSGFAAAGEPAGELAGGTRVLQVSLSDGEDGFAEEASGNFSNSDGADAVWGLLQGDEPGGGEARDAVRGERGGGEASGERGESFAQSGGLGALRPA